jgi:hypothetical protein
MEIEKEYGQRRKTIKRKITGDKTLKNVTRKRMVRNTN